MLDDPEIALKGVAERTWLSVDELRQVPYVLVGSGRRRGKLLVPGKAFAELPGAVVLEGLGVA